MMVSCSLKCVRYSAKSGRCSSVEVGRYAPISGFRLLVKTSKFDIFIP